jgi:cob(I)alamin adenosyltransferase
MKIYTKRGDGGTTSLLGGARVPKHHLRIETYGTVDELNSYIGLLRDLAPEADKAFLLRIQDRLFTMGSHLALEPDHAGKMNLPELAESDIEALEKAMDSMEENLPEMKHFVLPGGHVAVSHCHIARCICRRAERLVTALNEQESTGALILPYLNRLSDYLFVLSRWWTIVFKAEEKPWIPA